MITQCNSDDIHVILAYIGNNYKHCLYLYVNLLKYGANSNNVKVYTQKNNENITAVILTYYSCLHIYSALGDFDENEVIKLFFDNSLTMVYCTRMTAEKIWKSWPKSNRAIISYGWVAQITKVDKPDLERTTLAKADDFQQIVQLIYNDEDIGKSYDYKGLSQQLIERVKEGFARNLVIKDNNLVVAHACTNAEVGNIAIAAELIVRKEYRQQGFATDIWRNICSQLLFEGKEVYSFYYSKESQSLHKKIGFFEVCEWAKIVIEG